MLVAMVGSAALGVVKAEVEKADLEVQAAATVLLEAPGAATAKYTRSRKRNTLRLCCIA